MKRMVESITGGYTSSAKVVDNTLVISLPDALSPIVWRMDLSQVRSSALEVRERDGQHILALKTPRADVHDIAPFASRGEAVRALMAVSRALEQGEQRASSRAAAPLLASEVPPPVAAAPRRSNGVLKWAAIIAAVLIIVLLISAARHAAPVAGEIGAGGPAATSFSGTPVNTPGQPISADSFLMQNGGKAPETSPASPPP